jgi:hypothetical protein
VLCPYGLGPPQEFHDRDDQTYRGVLDESDELVAQRREYYLEGLRQDDEEHRLVVGHAQRSGGFHLALVDRFDARLEDLGHVCPAVHGKCHDTGGESVDVKGPASQVLDEERQAEVDEEKLE